MIYINEINNVHYSKNFIYLFLKPFLFKPFFICIDEISIKHVLKNQLESVLIVTASAQRNKASVKTWHNWMFYG